MIVLRQRAFETDSRFPPPPPLSCPLARLQIKLLQHWDANANAAPASPQCLTMTPGDLVSHPLLPVITHNEGW